MSIVWRGDEPPVVALLEPTEPTNLREHAMTTDNDRTIESMLSDPERVRERLSEGETTIGAFTTCVYCGRTIQPVIVWTSGLVDWEDNGDSGCPDSPDTNDLGTGGHVPSGNVP